MRGDELRNPFGTGRAAVAGAATGMLLYGVIYGWAAFDFTQTTAAGLLLHTVVGALMFVAGAVVRNRLAA